MVALGIFGALTKLKSAANDLPYTSQVALGLFGQCSAQASKVAHCVNFGFSCVPRERERVQAILGYTFQAAIVRL